MTAHILFTVRDKEIGYKAEAWKRIMTDEEIQAKVAEQLSLFYMGRLDKLSKINLSTLFRKNSYLFRVASGNNASDVIEEVLKAFLLLLDEAEFSIIFFEPFVLAAGEAKQRRIAGEVQGSASVPTRIVSTFIAVDFADNPHKIDAQARQSNTFLQSRAHIQETTGDSGAMFAYCYGYATGSRPPNDVILRLAGQPFWEELTGDSEFYIKIVHAMGSLPDQHRELYTAALETLTARLRADFGVNFLYPDGKIHWDRLLAYNSGKDARIRLQRAVIEPTTNTIVLEEIPEYETAPAAAENVQAEDDEDTE